MLGKSHNKIATAAAALLALLAGAPGAALACPSEAYIGAVCTVAFDFCPDGYMAASGQELAIPQYSALYSLLGNRYGGNNTTTFNLPDLRGRVVVGVNPTPQSGLSAFQLGQKRGAESVALSVNQMAPHIHPAALSGASTSGNVSLPVSGNTTSAAVTGTVTSTVLTSQTSGAGTSPGANFNTVGKNGLQANFYPYNSSATVATPTTINLTAPSTTVSGTASGPATLPVTGAVAVGSNPTNNTPVPVVDPGMALTTCIAVYGIYPTRP